MVSNELHPEGFPEANVRKRNEVDVTLETIDKIILNVSGNNNLEDNILLARLVEVLLFSEYQIYSGWTYILHYNVWDKITFPFPMLGWY